MHELEVTKEWESQVREQKNLLVQLQFVFSICNVNNEIIPSIDNRSSCSRKHVSARYREKNLKKKTQKMHK